MAKTNIPLPAIIAIVVLAVLIILWYSVLYLTLHLPMWPTL